MGSLFLKVFPLGLRTADLNILWLFVLHLGFIFLLAFFITVIGFFFFAIFFIKRFFKSVHVDIPFLSFRVFLFLLQSFFPEIGISPLRNKETINKQLTRSHTSIHPLPTFTLLYSFSAPPEVPLPPPLPSPRNLVISYL